LYAWWAARVLAFPLAPVFFDVSVECYKFNVDKENKAVKELKAYIS
jgi:hypothetical protein